jgi:type I restriction enzyme R subunit
LRLAPPSGREAEHSRQTCPLQQSESGRRLAIKVDETVKRTRPDGWRGIQARENVIKRALLDVLGNVADVERIFPIIKAQSEY